MKQFSVKEDLKLKDLKKMNSMIQQHKKLIQEHKSSIRQKGIELNYDFYVVFGKH